MEIILIPWIILCHSIHQQIGHFIFKLVLGIHMWLWLALQLLIKLKGTWPPRIANYLPSWTVHYLTLNYSHSRTLVWKIQWTEEPRGLQSMGLLRVGHDWATLLSLFTFLHWRRKWQPTPVFLPGESQGQGSLVGCHLWGCTESDMTEAT